MAVSAGGQSRGVTENSPLAMANRDSGCAGARGGARGKLRCVRILTITAYYADERSRYTRTRNDYDIA
jgi:hypothetical protein